jgi:WD40 repeat protein
MISAQESGLTFSRDGRMVMGGRGTVLDADTAKPIRKLPFYTNPFEGGVERQLNLHAVALAQRGKNAISAERDGAAVIWDVADGKAIGQIPRCFDYGEAVGFSSDGALMVVSRSYPRAPFYGPHECGIWDTATGKKLLAFELEDIQAPRKFIFTEDKKRLIVGIYDGSICIVDAKNGKEIRRFQANHKNLAVQAMAVSPDGTMVACSGIHHPSVRVWDVNTGAPVHRFPVPKVKLDPKVLEPLVPGHPVCWALAFSPDNAVLASGGPDGQIILWDMRPKRQEGK